MVARSARSRPVRVRSARRPGDRQPCCIRACQSGLAARGIMYGLIGIIAVQIALGSTHIGEADRSGAVRLVAATPFGSVMLWLLVIGFTGLTLWRCPKLPTARQGPAGTRLGSASLTSPRH